MSSSSLQGGRTALHLAARNGFPAVVELLVNANADVTAQAAVRELNVYQMQTKVYLSLLPLSHKAAHRL